MKSKNKLVWLKYYETSMVSLDFATGQYQLQLSTNNIVDHNNIILEVNDDLKSPPYRGQIYYAEALNRITFRGGKWYYSLEPRVKCDQGPLIRMANLARNYAIQFAGHVREFYWLRASYKMEGIYR